MATNDIDETRQERRGKKLRKKHAQIQKHGKDLAQVYKNALLKRISKKSP